MSDLSRRLRLFLAWWDVPRATLTVEVLGLIAVVVSLIFAVRSVNAATAAVEASQLSLEEAKYQSVYERQLDLWRLAIEEPEAGAYFMAASDIERGAPSKAQKKAAVKHAAIASALDFYAYIWSQQAERNTAGRVPAGLNPAPSDRPREVTEDAWRHWMTWASTIRSGFCGSPDLFHVLLVQKDSYDDDFVSAVSDAMNVCP